MNKLTAQQITTLNTYILGVISGVIINVLGIQNVLLLLPVHKGDKRFNQ